MNRKWIIISIILLINISLLYKAIHFITIKDWSNNSLVYKIKDIDHSNVGQWHGVERGTCSDYFITDHNEIFLNQYLYNVDTHKKYYFCQRENCFHTDLDCISNNSWCSVIYNKDDYFALNPYKETDIFRINNNSCDSIYHSSIPIRFIWGYNNDIYYCTDYEIRRFSLVTRQSYSILNRPTYNDNLFFSGDSIIFLDDCNYVCSMNLDGSNEKLLTQTKATMLEVLNGEIYYRDAVSYKLLHLKGTCEEEIISEPCYRYYILEDGIYYYVESTQELKYFNPSSSCTNTLLKGITCISYCSDKCFIISRDREPTEIETKKTTGDTFADYYYDRITNDEYLLQTNEAVTFY